MDTISEPQLPQGPAPAGKPTLLIVDDEEGPRQSLRIVFKNEYNVLVASDGLEAIMLARSNPISVVLPCHRLIGANGSLVKYGGGLERKRWLLRHEGVEV